jgi:hypothetical protein
MTTALIKLILGISLVIAVVVFGPLLGIWSINIFGQYLWPDKIVPYTWQTWAAFFFLFAGPAGLKFGSNK